MIYKAIQGLPQAHARIKGSKEYPDIRGNVYLYEVYNGTVLLGELMGIPEELEKKESFPIHSYHLDVNHHVNNGQYS